MSSKIYMKNLITHSIKNDIIKDLTQQNIINKKDIQDIQEIINNTIDNFDFDNIHSINYKELFPTIFILNHLHNNYNFYNKNNHSKKNIKDLHNLNFF